MANEPTKQDIEKLEARIKEITKRSDSFHASVDETHKAAEQTKAATAASSKELGNIKQRKS
jgi:cell division septum initiation protein DivIVA